MTVKFTNNANSTLASGINSSVTSMTLADASSFPSLSGANDYCYLTLQESGGTTREIVKATARSSNTFTIVRGQDNTSAATWSSGVLVELRITSALLQDVIDGLGSGSMMDTDIFTGDGSDTTFTLSRQPDNENNLLIFIDGVFQAHNAYSVSGTTLTLSAAPANGRVITAYHMATTVGGSNLIKATMTGDNSDTTLDVGSQIIHENNVQVYFDGVYQSKGNYSVSGSVITFSTAPPTGVAVEAILNTATNISTATQLADADSDTLIQVEESSDEDTIRMDIAGTEVLTLTNSAMTLKGTTPTLTIGDAGAEDTKIVFDGNAQDFYIGLDDSADDLIIGLGSTVGTTPIISVDENKDVAIPDGSLTITTSDNTTQLTLKSTDADEGSGPVLDMIRDSASPEDSDVLGRIRFRGDNDAGEETTIVYLQTYLHDASDGTEDGGLDLFARQAGTLNRRITINSSGEICFNEDSADIDFRVETNGDSHRLFIDGGNNRVLIGTTASRTMSGVTPDFFIEGTSYADSGLGAVINANGAIDCPVLLFGKSRGTSLGSNTVVQNGDRLFTMRFDGSDGTNLEQAALIEAYVDAAPANNSVPGRLSFWTTNDGAQYATEKMRIDNSGISTFTPGIGDFSIKSNDSSPQSGIILEGVDANHAIYFRRGRDGTLNTMDFHEYSTFRFFTGGAIASQTQRVVIGADGKVGIGTDSPSGRLMVEADGSSEDIFMINNTRSGSNSTAIQQFKREGTNTGYIANTSSATSYATSQSDRRAKKNFEDWTESVLSHFKDLKPTKFHFTQEDDSDEKNKGYIAQDLVGSFPEAYPLKDSGEDAGRYFFNPSGMVVYLMKAIQEQQVLIETLEAEVKALKEA